MGKYFVGQALFLAVREFLPQGAVSDSVKAHALHTDCDIFGLASLGIPCPVEGNDFQ